MKFTDNSVSLTDAQTKQPLALRIDQILSVTVAMDQVSGTAVGTLIYTAFASIHVEESYSETLRRIQEIEHRRIN